MSPVCAPEVTRNGRSDTPTDTPQQAAPGVSAPHLTWRGLPTVFSTGRVLTVLQEIMTETGILRRVVYEACGRSILGSILVVSEVNSGHFLVNSQ